MKKKLYFLQELRFYCRIAEGTVLECYVVSIGKQLPMS